MRIPILVAVVAALLLVMGIAMWIYEESALIPGDPDYDYDGDGVPDPGQPVTVVSYPLRDWGPFLLAAGIVVGVVSGVLFWKSLTRSRPGKEAD
jgi:hypothetical protein